MSTWKNLSPWVHKYNAVRITDEEDNKPETTAQPGRQSFPRISARDVRLILILLFLGVFALAGFKMSANMHLPTPEAVETSPESPLLNNNLELYPGSHVETDWSKFAYVQYVTRQDYLCNSVMIFETLHRLGSRAERLMMYPEEWSLTNSSSEAVLLRKARDEYKVNVLPIHVQHYDGEATWSDSFTKLLAFNQTQYQRVISLDSDANVLQPMDELFFLPQVPVAMPRAYWMDNTLSSQMIVIQPSNTEFERIKNAFEHRKMDDFDMDIMNNIYGRDCLIIPHRKYDLLTGEFRSKNHSRYLGSTTEEWNPRAVLEEAKFLHFSDWPFPKPWLSGPEETRIEVQPECHNTTAGEEDCTNREIWNEIYREFRERRQRVCGANFMPVTVEKRSEPQHARRLPSPFEPIF
ncbi:nucleotide-diphospho-sugar transferase [Aureobasidium subglaciale]|nr:nucleotide-diphospho-sugar transferase [Aureobasidium subglaciale]